MTNESNTLRFCMVSTFYPPYNFGGDGIVVYRLSNALARRGHQVDVIHCADAFKLSQPTYPTGSYPNHPNITVHTLKSRAGSLSPLLTQQTGRPVLKQRKLEQILEGGRYDVIHYHNMSLIGLSALQIGRAIKLYTLHEHWLACPMHVLWRFDREICSKRTCLRCTVAGGRPPQLWRYSGFRDRMLKHVDMFLSPSEFAKRKHLELGLKIPIARLPYFLPMSADAPWAPLNSNFAEKPYFLFVGRLEKIKGLQTLIPIFKRNPQYRLLVAGDGSYAPALRELARGAPNINFVGWLSYQQLQELYRCAIAVVVPSICYEVFGLVVIEAFAAGTPVIAHDLGALPEMVRESGGGMTYRDQDELAACIHTVAGDRDLRNRLGANGQKAQTKYWTEESHVRAYLGMIDGLREQRQPELAASMA